MEVVKVDEEALEAHDYLSQNSDEACDFLAEFYNEMNFQSD